MREEGKQKQYKLYPLTHGQTGLLLHFYTW